MRKQILFVTFVLLFGHSACPKPVTKEQVITWAATEIKNRVASFEGKVESIKPVSAENQSVYYIINYTPQGWALISADDAAAPLLAYSCEGHYTQESQPESMQAWLAGYSNQILALKEQPGLPTQQEWAGSASLRSSGTKIDPILQVNWNQTSPYNAYCPSNSDGRALVGCVAVAMAQAMTVSRTPDRPQGQVSYNSDIYGALGIDYDAEAPYNWNSIMTGANNKGEVARLLYHCGIAVRMTYSATGSGAYSSAVATALKQNFSYSASAKHHARFSSTAEWERLLLTELQSGRVIVYAGNDGSGATGHCFNLDGYDGASMYHVNWGWGGTNNGYYRIDNLHDQYSNYTQGHSAVVGIKPIYYGPSDILLSNTSVGEQLGIGANVGTISVESEVSPEDGYEYELKGPYSLFLGDYTPAEFYVENHVLKAKNNFVYSELEAFKTLYIKAINRANRLAHEKMFAIAILQQTGVRPIDAASGIQIRTENHRLSITVDKPCQYTLYTPAGQILGKASLPAGTHQLPNLIDSGCYLIAIACNNRIYTKKLCL
jgi:hypothetical protein